MWINPWKRARQLKEQNEQLLSQNKAHSAARDAADHRTHQANEALESCQKQLASLQLQLDQKCQVAQQVQKELAALKSEIQEIRKKLDATADANNVLGKLAQGRLEKLHRVKGVLDSYQPSPEYIRSNKGLRTELEMSREVIHKIQGEF